MLDIRQNGLCPTEYKVIEPVIERSVEELEECRGCRDVSGGKKPRHSGILAFIGWMGCRSCCLVVIVLGLLILGGVDVFVNSNTRGILIASADYVLGMQTSVDNVDIGVLSAKSAVHNFTVGNPYGIGGNMFEVDKAVFDLNLNSLLSRTISMNEIHLHGVRVSIVTMNNGDSNVKAMDRHVSKRIKEQQKLVQEFGTVKDIHTKIIANKVAVSGINITIVTNDKKVQMAPVQIAGIRIVDIGHQKHGVHIYEFMEIITNAILKATRLAAPSSVHATLISKLEHALDYGEMQVDMGGDVGRLDTTPKSSELA